MAVLLDFFLQVTAFVALIVFDCLRAEDNRIDCFPCIKIPSSGGESDEGIFLSNHYIVFIVFLAVPKSCKQHSVRSPVFLFASISYQVILVKYRHQPEILWIAGSIYEGKTFRISESYIFEIYGINHLVKYRVADNFLLNLYGRYYYC